MEVTFKQTGESTTGYRDGYKPSKMSWYDNAGRGGISLDSAYSNIEPWNADSLLSVSGGKVTITARDGYIVDVSGLTQTTRDFFKLNRTDANNYKTYTTNYHTTQVAITTSVTFDKMGYTGNLGKIVVKDENGSAVHTVSVTGSSTLGGINTALGNYGDVAVASDGKVTITARLGYQVDVSGLNDTVETTLIDF